jgi:hypothetical protein
VAGSLIFGAVQNLERVFWWHQEFFGEGLVVVPQAVPRPFHLAFEATCVGGWCARGPFRPSLSLAIWDRDCWWDTLYNSGFYRGVDLSSPNDNEVAIISTVLLEYVIDTSLSTHIL